MAEKLLGKLLSIKFDNAEVDVQSHNYDESFNVIDVTDTATSGDGKETITSRATRELKIDGLLKSGGVAQKGNNMNFLFNSVSYKVTDINFEETYDEIDQTDSGTTGDGTEFQAGFAERKTSLSLWVQDTVASIARGVQKAATLTFASGITIAGNFRPESMKNEGEVKGSIKQTIDGTWQGSVTETPNPLGGLAMAVSKSVDIIYKVGTPTTGTDKKLSGTATIFARSISAEASGEIKISWSMKFNGAVTETQWT